MNATDGEWLQDQLWDAKAKKRRLLLPTEKPIKIPRMVITDGVPLGIAPEARGPATIKWDSKEPGAMMRSCRTDPGEMSPQCFDLEKILFDGNGIASALQSWGGFTKGATVRQCGFWRCVGPVIQMRACWSSIFYNLKFTSCKGGLMDLEDHSAGVVSVINAGYCKTNGDGRPAFRFRGTCGSVSHFNLDSWTHYPDLPLILLDGCGSKRVADIRLEGGEDKGVEAYCAVELRDCGACGVVDVQGVFNPLRPAHCVVRIVGVAGRKKNYLVGIWGGRGRTLAEDGCIVEATPGSVRVNEMSVFNHFEPGHPKHRPDLVEVPRTEGES